MFEHLNFCHPWRKYQAKILTSLALYRQDKKVHIVAPPGAGKTVLGLEIIRRYAQRTLILAPSLTIRAQWAERLQKDFCTDGILPKGFISHDLYQPSDLTIVTYQAFHYYLKENEAHSLDWMQVLVVDECHHLRREWWRSLNSVHQEVQPELVALTATPPFDVSGLEWRRYHQFCGEIDEQISIPELVAAGDLCYHQDYVYPVLPSTEVIDRGERFAQQKQELYTLVGELHHLSAYLLQHPWLREPEKHYEALFAEPEYFSALLIILGHLGSEPPAPALGVLHGEVTIAPELTDEWLTIFLQKALRDDPYLQHGNPAEILRPIKRKLTEMGAWEKGRLHLDEPPGLSKDIRNSSAKIRAVSDIVIHEWEQLGDELRMVVLTDFIHPELLPTTAYDRAPLDRVGVSTLFEQLRRNGLTDGQHVLENWGQTIATERLAVLTGSLVILPTRVLTRFEQLVEERLPAAQWSARPLFPDSAYSLIDAGSLSSKFVVRWVTQLFTEGAVHIIIGTKSLLGEGWDAPAINSLVLASTVGSFVLSNQMRGRAIRTNAAVPHKTANIWHPVTVNPALPHGGSDLRGLQRRFRAFAGPNAQGEPVIMNGLGRYAIDWEQAAPEDIEALAKRMLAFAQQRNLLAERWTTALTKGTQLVEAIEPPQERYYRREDALSVHYFEQSDRQQRVELNDFKMSWKGASIMTFCLALFFAVTNAFPFWMSYAFVPLTAGVGYFLVRGLRNLQGERARIGLSAIEAEMPDWRYVVGPLMMTAVLAYFSWLGGLFYLTVLVFLLYLALPEAKNRKDVRRYELLASSRERLERYGRALVHSLLEAGKLRFAKAHQFTVEETDGQDVAYLVDADHHDTHLFAESMSELMCPVDNPRWLLRLRRPEEWRTGEYYLPVPTELARRKESAQVLKNYLEEELEEQFDLVYTRDPAGRQHLLTARLQLAALAQDRQARREMLWR
ncbi:MAG: DEAD/DEAH box helicase family protein [Bacteroidota bacterium]